MLLTKSLIYFEAGAGHLVVKTDRMKTRQSDGPLEKGQYRFISLALVRALAALLVLASGLFNLPAMGMDRGRPPRKRVDDPGRRVEIPSPFRGSMVEYRNIVTVRSFDRDADLTYNPYYAMELHLAPMFAAGSYTHLKLDVLMNREFTDSDETTKQGEIILDDIFLEVGWKYLPQIPVLDIAVTPSLRLYVPSSEISKGRTLILGIRPGINFLRTFKVFNGLTFEWRFAMHKNLNESTTLQAETPVVHPLSGSLRSAESFSNLGDRVVSFAIINVLSIELAFKKRFAFLVGMAISHGFLYPISDTDPRISYSSGPDTQVRYKMEYTGELSYSPRRWIALALGFLTENYQLAQDATYEAPFINRYTGIFFDIRLDVERLSSRLERREKRGKK
jgi:hypothetical protein